MRPPRHDHGFRARLRLALAGALALALLVASAAAAQGEGPGGAGGPSPTSETSETSTSTSSTSTVPGSEAPTGVHGQVSEPTGASETPPTAQGGVTGTTEATATTPAPEVEAQSPQAAGTPGGVSGTSHHGHAHRGSGGTGAGGPSSHSAKQPSTLPPPAPSALTPPLPGALGVPISGISNFFIESFRVPPFLLPIYQAAGTAYDIPWQVLAAINEVETDYGRDLSVSSAGAEGWMQFLPSSWARYGVDANGDGYEDPYNPADAIFAAARYLQAAGGAQHIRAAIFTYNHSQAYVESVMLRAQLLEGTPPELLSAITGLTESRFPVHAPAHFTDGFPAGARRTRSDARGDDDLLAGGSAGDRRAGRRGDRRRGLADARALRVAARRLRQHLHLRAAGQRGRALSGARTAHGDSCQRPHRFGRLRPQPAEAERPRERRRAAALSALGRGRELGSGVGRGERSGNAAPGPGGACAAAGALCSTCRCVGAAGLPRGPRRGLPASAGLRRAGAGRNRAWAHRRGREEDGTPPAPASASASGQPALALRPNRTCSSRSVPPARERR